MWFEIANRGKFLTSAPIVVESNQPDESEQIDSTVNGEVVSRRKNVQSQPHFPTEGEGNSDEPLEIFSAEFNQTLKTILEENYMKTKIGLASLEDMIKETGGRGTYQKRSIFVLIAAICTGFLILMAMPFLLM